MAKIIPMTTPPVMYTIEKGVPIPSTSKAYTYPFETMEVGDSFAAPYNKAPTIRSSASHYVRRHSPKTRFVLRKDGDMIRVWRIK